MHFPSSLCDCIAGKHESQGISLIFFIEPPCNPETVGELLVSRQKWSQQFQDLQRNSLVADHQPDQNDLGQSNFNFVVTVQYWES